MKPPPDKIRLIPEPVEIEAAEEDGSKPKTFSALAYSGGKLNITGFSYPVIIDLATMTARAAAIPINLHHKAEEIVGHATAKNDGKKVLLQGVVSGALPAAKQFIESSANGFPWGVSIEATSGKQDALEKGETASVNGQTQEGPAIIARHSVLTGAGIVTIPADANSSVSIAAAFDEQFTAGFEEWLRGMGFDPSTLTDHQRESLMGEWQSKQAATSAECAIDLKNLIHAADSEIEEERQKLTTNFASAIREGVAFDDQTRQDILATADRGDREQLILASQKVRTMQLTHLRSSRPTPPKIVAVVDGATNAKVIEAALCLTAGLEEKFIGDQYGEDVTNMAMERNFRDFSIHGVCAAVMQAAGRPMEAGRRFNDETIRAAFHASNQIQASEGFSTMSLPGVLSNVQNKAMLQVFQSIEVLAEKLCLITDVKDFKPFHRYRLTGKGALGTIGGTGELDFVSLQDEDFSGELDTVGGIININRQMIINDDLSALMQVPQILGRMAALAREKAVFKTLLAATNSYFTSSNYFSGADTNLSITSLSTAVKLFRQQTDKNGDPILASPALLLVPPELETTADNLIGESNVVVTVMETGSVTPATTAPARNPHAGKYSLAVSPYLSNASYSGYSATAWYLFAAPTDIPAMFIGYLNGNALPIIETAQMNFNSLGLSSRCVYDFGVALGDGRGACKSKGAA